MPPGDPKNGSTIWTLDTLYHYLSGLIRESDRRYEQRFKSQEKAIIKAEKATGERLKSLNEFRQVLSDQTATFMPRSETEQRLASLDEKYALLSARQDREEGQSGGISTAWGWMVAVIMALLSFISLLALYWNHK